MVSRGHWTVVVALAFAGLQGSPSTAKAPLVLAPSGPWHLDYSPDSCTLIRTFGKGEDEVSIRLEQFEPGPLFDLTFIGKAFRSDSLFKEVRFAFGPGQPLRPAARAVTGSARTRDKKNFNMLFVGHAALLGRPAEYGAGNPPRLIDERAISELSIVQKNGADLVLKLGPMDKPMQQMRLCMDELLTHWGIDPAKQRTLTRRAKPIGNPGKWLRSGDYPKGSLYRGESALIHFRVTVSADGRVSGCAIQRATKGDAFARTSCDLIRQRAQFEPALDAEGRPVPSYYVNSVRWLASPPD